MKEEKINPNFNINAKYESMLEEANKIIKVYLETTNLYEEDGRYNLAYDVKNYLPKLLEENKSLQSQLKEKEEVIKEAREYNQNIVDDYLKEDDCEYCDGRYATATHNLEILSKYKEIVEEKYEIQNK